MAFKHQMQASRYELKYWVKPSVADAINAFARPFLEPDPNYIRGTRGYPVHSLYLDNSNLALYRQTIQGCKNRFKLRIRFYDDEPDSPSFLEIKSRNTSVILKQRAIITKKGSHELLQGNWPSIAELVKGDEKSLKALEDFCRLRDQIGAVGSHYVSYLREAYVSPDSDHVRVTFDRDVKGGYYEQGDPLRIPTRQNAVDHKDTILELKFTDRFPGWMGDLVRNFSLQRTSIPKYCDCVEAAGLQASNSAFGFQGGLRL